MGRELGNCHHVLLAFWQQYLLYNIFALPVFTLPGAGAGASQPVNTAGAGETQERLSTLSIMRAAKLPQAAMGTGVMNSTRYLIIGHF